MRSPLQRIAAKNTSLFVYGLCGAEPLSPRTRPHIPYYTWGRLLVIVLREASIGYRGEPVLRNVSAELRGRVVLLGPNGAGKTTLMRGVAGIADIYSGEVLVDGVSAAAARGHAGLLGVNLPEAYNLLYLDAYRVLELYMDLLGGDIGYALETLERLGLDKDLLRRRKPWELSAGQLKAFTTVAALASNAGNILLDEPFEQLDPAHKTRTLSLIEQSKTGTLVLATHETWLLRRLRSWNVYLVFSGRLWGPIGAEELLGSGVVRGRARDAILVVEANGFVMSLVRGRGEPLTRLVSLDHVYEVLMEEA